MNEEKILSLLNSPNALPKMRTIKELAKLLKEEDPQTAMSERGIRSLAVSGQIPCVRVGTKILISLEAFNRCMNGETKEPEEARTSDIFPTMARIPRRA